MSDRAEATRFDDWPPLPLAPKMFREQCWRMIGPSNKILSCYIVRIETGLEVRLGYTDDDMLSTRERTMQSQLQIPGETRAEPTQSGSRQSAE